MEEQGRQELQVCFFSDGVFHHAARYGEADIERLTAKLVLHCRVAKPRFHMRRSATPSPDFISIPAAIAGALHRELRIQTQDLFADHGERGPSAHDPMKSRRE